MELRIELRIKLKDNRSIKKEENEHKSSYLSSPSGNDYLRVLKLDAALLHCFYRVFLPSAYPSSCPCL